MANESRSTQRCVEEVVTGVIGSINDELTDLRADSEVRVARVNEFMLTLGKQEPHACFNISFTAKQQALQVIRESMALRACKPMPLNLLEQYVRKVEERAQLQIIGDLLTSLEEDMATHSNAMAAH